MNATEYAASIKPDREAWRESVPQVCMWCGTADASALWGPCGGLQIHEMERRSHASKRWWHRCNGLLLCGVCHGMDFAAMPHAAQLAVKLARDPEHFDLAEWLAIGSRPATYVTVEDVKAEYKRIYGVTPNETALRRLDGTAVRKVDGA